MENENNESEKSEDKNAILGEDVVLREREQLTDLLDLLPLRAQLGFSGLKEKWHKRGDKGLKDMISAAAKTNDPLMVEYTCLDVTPKTIVFGSNLGIVYFYDRATRRLSKFVCDQKQVPITSIKFLESRQFVATGQFSGAVTLFHYGEERNGIMKVNLKCTVESHHITPVTTIQWTPNGTKLFTGDSEGNVAITVINMDEGKTHTVFICKEDSPVVQLSFSHAALLISTLRRTLVWPFSTKKIQQVGMQERKVPGNFGACFFPPAGPVPSDEVVDVYAVRPGLRLWRASTEGKVITTMMFRESINKGQPEILTIDLPSNHVSPHAEQKQFGPIKTFHDQFLITWQGSNVWVLDPTTGVVVGCHSNLGCVVDVGVVNNEIFVLSRAKENFVRRILFEVNPCIVVEELDLNNPADVMKAQQHGSVNQFEDQDRLDKILDEVGSKMGRAFFDVKSRVKGIKEQIRSREVSEDDRGGGSESERFSSPRANYNQKAATLGDVAYLATSEGYSTGNNTGYTTDDNEFSDRPFESSSNESLGSPGKNAAEKDNNGTVKPLEKVDETDLIVPSDDTRENPEKNTEHKTEDTEKGGDDTQTISVLLTHKTREKEPVFSHLSKEEFPKDIVFQGTSLAGTRRKKTKKKTKKANTPKITNHLKQPESNLNTNSSDIESLPTATVPNGDDNSPAALPISNSDGIPKLPVTNGDETLPETTAVTVANNGELLKPNADEILSTPHHNGVEGCEEEDNGDNELQNVNPKREMKEVTNGKNESAKNNVVIKPCVKQVSSDSSVSAENGNNIVVHNNESSLLSNGSEKQFEGNLLVEPEPYSSSNATSVDSKQGKLPEEDERNLTEHSVSHQHISLHDGSENQAMKNCKENTHDESSNTGTPVELHGVDTTLSSSTTLESEDVVTQNGDAKALFSLSRGDLSKDETNQDTISNENRLVTSTEVPENTICRKDESESNFSENKLVTSTKVPEDTFSLKDESESNLSSHQSTIMTSTATTLEEKKTKSNGLLTSTGTLTHVKDEMETLASETSPTTSQQQQKPARESVKTSSRFSRQFSSSDSESEYGGEKTKNTNINSLVLPLEREQYTPVTVGNSHELHSPEGTSTSRDRNVVHVVKLSSRHTRQGSNVSVASLTERCREIQGEAVEHHTPVKPPFEKPGDDSLEGNLQPSTEPLTVEHQRHDESDEDGKLYPISPFPPPQTQQSIYSQRSMSLSEFSLEQTQELLGDEDERLLEDMMEYDRIDVQNDLIESIDSITDVEDNDSPVDIITESGAKAIPATLKRKRKKKTRGSYPNSPSSSDLEGRPVAASAKDSGPETIRDRLRYLADSWAGVNIPEKCGQIQTIACSSLLVWLIDNQDQVYYSPAAMTSHAYYTWKKLESKAMHISTNQNGSIVWCIDRNGVAHYRVGIKETAPQGSQWEPFEKNIHYLAVDKDSVWMIRKNGDVLVRTGVSNQLPWGATLVPIKANSDLVQITCMDGIVWALDIYNHVQIFQGDLRVLSVTDPAEQEVSWVELPGIAASQVTLGSNAVCWIIDKDHGVWFNQDVSRENPCGGAWYQLSLGENRSENQADWYSSVLSYFTKGNEPKQITANSSTGVIILGKQGSVHVAHGHLLGVRWEAVIPMQIKTNGCWTCVSAGGADMNKGYVWALQPNGQLVCFKSGRQTYNVHPPNRVVLKYCSAGPRSLWALTSGQDVYVRLGISDTCPQGLKWLKVDMLAQGNSRLMNISAGNHVVWAVDCDGNAWFQMGREDRRGVGFAPAWVPVEGCPLDGNKFTKIVVGPDDFIVWACDDKNNVYARKDVIENFWVGTAWEIVSGSSGKDLAISNNHVWCLTPKGDVLCRFGVTSSNVCGDYWKKVPGNFEKISVGANDELWGIDRFGHLYERETLLFYGSTLSCRAPSYDDLFSDHNDWEFI